MRLLKSVYRLLLTAIFLLAAFQAQADEGHKETKERAERFLMKEVAWFQKTVTNGSQTDIRLRQAATPLIEAVGIWNNSGELAFPDQESSPHIYDIAITHNLNRLEALRNASQPNAWEANDIKVNSLFFCSNNTLSICILVHTGELAKSLDIPKDQLINALFYQEEAQPNSMTYLLIALGALGLILIAIVRFIMPVTVKVKTKSSHEAEHVFRMGDMEVDSKRMCITRDGDSANISQRDLKLLSCLYQHPDEVLSKDTLYNAGWGREFIPNSRSLEQHIMTLRRKIDPQRNRSTLIETVHGQGYRFPKSQS